MLRLVTLLFLASGLLHTAHGVGAGAEARVRIVFFTPSDVEPPGDVRQRMKDVVDYGQTFYGRWLQHWGYEPENVLPIDRDEDGLPVVYFVKGSETAASGKYDEVGFQGAVREQAIAEHGIPRAGSTWWIFVYGTRLRASRGWGGWGDDRGNGLALLVWHADKGELTPEMPLAAGLADQINLKGYLHELGHTMSLPHIGASDAHGLGMSLMGPNARTYRRARSNREERVYITPATAALIWKQPQMTGRFEAQPKVPRVVVRDFQAVYDGRKKRLVLKGRLESDLDAHSVVAVDIPEKGPGDYWKKGYAARLLEQGEFELPVDELLPSNGVLKVVFCFENGTFTGTGKGLGFRHAAEIPYEYSSGRYRVLPQRGR
jgi:hypothetical protein